VKKISNLEALNWLARVTFDTYRQKERTTSNDTQRRLQTMVNRQSLVRVIYFDGRGRAEPIRLILELVGVQYEQPEITFESWPSVKPNYPFGQLPVYEELSAGDETTLIIPQSHAIFRYLARKHKLYGNSEEDRIRCEVIEEVFRDYWQELGMMCWDKDWKSKKEAYDTSISILFFEL